MYQLVYEKQLNLKGPNMELSYQDFLHQKFAFAQETGEAGMPTTHRTDP
jgi:hypothetical protein